MHINGHNVNFPPVTIGNEELKKANVIRYLGFYVDDRLSFKSHCSIICKKAHNVANFIHGNYHCRSSSFLMGMYSTYMPPLAEYGTPCYNPFSKESIRKIEGIQKCFTRRIPCLSRQPYSERLASTGTDSLHITRIKNDITLLCKMTHGLIDSCFAEFFELSSTNGRARGNDITVRIPSCKTNIKKYAFCSQVSKVWNALPTEVVASSSLLRIKKSLDATQTKQILLRF